MGASGFLLKDTPPEQLVDAIRIVAGGEALLSPSVHLVVSETRSRPTSPVWLGKLHLAYESGLVQPGAS